MNSDAGVGLAQRQILEVKVLAEAAGAVALAGALNLVKIYSLPSGGSVTLASMVPILLLALRRGPLIGIVSGVVFGLVVLVEEPFIVHPAQVLLDYPLAFGALGVAGLIRSKPLLGVAAGITARFIFHFVSGVIFFSTFNLDGVIYSAAYNGAYLVPELIISGVVIRILIQRKALEAYL